MPDFEIRQRTFQFACAIVRFYMHLVKNTPTPWKIAEQLLSSGTSPAALLEEAEAAHSHADFVAKISIALKELREAHMWLRLLGACDLADDQVVATHLDEANQLVAILTAIRKNAGHRGDQ